MQSLNDNIYRYNCENLEFCNSDHGHIITGDLHFAKNQKLRKSIPNGPNFRVNP